LESILNLCVIQLKEKVSNDTIIILLSGRLKYLLHVQEQNKAKDCFLTIHLQSWRWNNQNTFHISVYLLHNMFVYLFSSQGKKIWAKSFPWFEKFSSSLFYGLLAWCQGHLSNHLPRPSNPFSMSHSSFLSFLPSVFFAKDSTPNTNSFHFKGFMVGHPPHPPPLLQTAITIQLNSMALR